MIPFEKLMKQSYPIHVLYIHTATEKLLRHQRLGHPCDQYLYNAHKYIDVVPKFSNATSKVLDQRPTCIQYKIPKTPPGHGTTCIAIQPYQSISIDFYFYGMNSDDSNQNTIHEVINGKTFWAFITDHFTGMKHGDARIYKTSLVAWIRYCFNQYSPTFNTKYIQLYQGGELSNNPLRVG